MIHSFHIMDEGKEQVKEPLWQSATEAELTEIRKRDPMAERAFVLKNNRNIVGFATYKISEPDAAVPERHMYLEWWKIDEGARSPKVASGFLSALHAYMKQNNIAVLDFEVRGMPPRETVKDATLWESERQHREKLIQVYERVAGGKTHVPEVGSTMFSLTVEQLSNTMTRSAIALAFSKL